MPHIIISYRRTDTDAIAGRIRDRLAQQFGDDSVFMDIDSIPFGTDFREQIKQALVRNDVLVALVGPKWLGPRKGGHFRIMEETDPVRIEIETALKSGNVVIPVLVGRARMPSPTELPDSLKNFSFRNAAEIDSGRDFHPHMERLIRAVEEILAQKSKPPAAASNEADEPPTGASMPKSSEPAHAGATPASAPRAEEQPASRPSWTPWLVGMFVVLVVGLGGGFWFYLRSQNQPAQLSVQPRPQPKLSKPAGGTGSSAWSGCNLAVPPTLADDFKVADPAWGLPTQLAYYVDGQLALKGSKGLSTLFYFPLRFKNVAICATIKAPTQIGSPDSNTQGGIIFWAEDVNNFYAAFVFANGTYAIFRMVENNWRQVAASTHFDSIKSGADAINEIQVSTKDNLGTLYINGAKVQEFRGQPPKDSSMVGLIGGPDEWRVLNVAVGDPDSPRQQAATKPPVPQVGTGCKPSRPVAFEANFKSADPGWDFVEDNTFSDGQFVLKPAANTSLTSLYGALLFKNATVCGHVKSPSQMTNIDGNSSAGLIFWAANRQNYYTAMIYPNGRFLISRLVNGTWTYLVRAAKSESVKPGLRAINEIMITSSVDMGSVYINGQKVWDFHGQPPHSGGSIGLLAQSDVAEATEWRFLDVVVAEGE